LKNSLEYITHIKPACWLRTAIYGLLVFVLYRSAFTYLVGMWQRDDFTYCYIIPFLCIYMIWEKRALLAETAALPSWSGLVPLGIGNREIRVSRAFMEKNGVRQLVYFWFPQRGRVLTDLYQIKLYNFWDALTRHRTDGALVRVITPLASGEEPAAAEERLQRFCRAAVPLLDGYLPR
jgi:hypothetical protein